MRAAILSVPRGQWEAGYTIGMTYLQTFRRIILPQALTLVQQGRADLTLHDSLSMLDYLKRTPDSGLKVAWQAPRAEWEPSGLIVAKENEAAIAPIDAALKELQADGTLKRLSEQFFGADVSVRDAK